MNPTDELYARVDIAAKTYNGYKRITLKQVNEIAGLLNLELIKGYDYYYWIGDDKTGVEWYAAVDGVSHSEMIYRLNRVDMNWWIRAAVAVHKEAMEEMV